MGGLCTGQTRSFYAVRRFPGLNATAWIPLLPKALETENAKLKKLLAETMLDNAMLKDLNAKKW